MSAFWKPTGLAGKIEGALKDVTDLAGSVVGGIGDQIGAGVSDIGKGIGGIFSDLVLEPVEDAKDEEGFFAASKATAGSLAHGLLEASGHGVQILFGAGEIVTSPIAGIGWGNIGKALDAPYQHLVEPAATDWFLGLKDAAGGSFRDGVTLEEGADIVTRLFGASASHGGTVLGPTGTLGSALPNERARTAAERKRYDYSLGQAVALLGSPDPRDQEAMRAYQEGQVFRMVAGTTDLIAPVVLDPLNAVGGVGAGVRTARWGIRAGDDLAQLAQSRRVAEVIDDMWKMREQNPEQASSLIRDKYFRNHAFGAELSDLFGTAETRNHSELIFRFAAGDLKAGEMLGATDPAAANRIRRAMGDQRLLRASGWTNDPDSLLHTEALNDLQREIDSLYPEIDRQNRMQWVFGTLTEIPRSSRYNSLRHSMTRSDLYQTRWGAPLRVIYQMRHHNFVVLDDPTSDTQVWRMLQKTGFSQDEQSKVHSAYLAARTPEQKASIIQQAQDAAMDRILTRYGYDTQDKEKILRLATEGREGFQKAAQSYASEGRASWKIVENGETTVVHKPLSASQHDQIEPLVRLSDFERIAKRYSPLEDKNRHLYETDLVTGEKQLSGKRTLPEKGFAVADSLLQDFQSLWKASVLLRPAYIARVPLGEEQLRIMALLGALAPAKYAKSGVHNIREDRILLNDLKAKFIDDFAETHGRMPTAAERRQIQAKVKQEYKTNHRTRGFRDVEITSRFSGDSYRVQAGFGDDGRPFQQRASTSAAWDQKQGREASLVQKEIERRLGKFHGTNNWKENLAWTDEAGEAGDIARANWTKALTDFTSRHIGTDAVYRKILQQHLDNQLEVAPNRQALRADVGEQYSRRFDKADEGLLAGQNQQIIDWLLSKDGAHYWNLLDDHLRANVEDWLDRMRDVVETYLPTATLKQRVLDGRLTLDDVTKEFSDIPRPMVHGEEIARLRADHPGKQIRKTFIDKMWSGIVQLPTEIASRNQVFNHVYVQEMQRQVDLLERARTVARKRNGNAFAAGKGDFEVGEITQDEIRLMERKARQVALNTTRKKMYDLAEESDLSHALRFVSPFFRAWQEVLTVWGGIALDNPVFVNQMRHAWETPDRAGVTATDANGEEYILVQVPDWLSEHFPAGALKDVESLRFSKKGFNTILTATPGAGPVVGVSLAELTKDNPEVRSHRALSLLFPFGVPESGADAAISSTLVNNVRAFADQDSTQRQNLMRNLYAAQMADYYAGRRTSRPDWNEIQEQASDMLALRTVANAILPTGAQFVSPFQPYIDTYRRLQEVDPNTADEKFYNAYGPEFFSLVTSTSKANAAIPPTIEAWREYSKPGVADLIADNPEYASLIIGEGAGSGAFNSNVYAWQLRTKLGPGRDETIRERVDPREAFARQQAETGWMEWNRQNLIITDELERRGLTDLNDPRAADIKQLKNEMVLQMSEQYPEWFQQFNVIDLGKWDRRAQALEKIAYSPSLRGRPEIETLQDYLEARQAIHAEMTRRARERGTSLVNANLKSNTNADLARTWLSLRAEMVARNPAFETLFHRYLERDTMGAEWEEAS